MNDVRAPWAARRRRRVHSAPTRLPCSTGVLYWTTRIALVAAWLLLAWRAYGRRRDWGGLAAAVAFAAVLFASVRAYKWNYAVLEAARRALRAAGVYEGRVGWKLALGGALLCAGVLLWRCVRRAAPEPRAIVCVAAMLLQAALLGIETFSLDDALPRVMKDQPGRYLIEGSCVALALWALRPARGGR